MKPPLSQIQFIQKAFLEKKASLSLAESMTGGGLSFWLVREPGASAYFKGGVICYDERVKREILRVSAGALREHGVVSEEVARLMAQGVKDLLKTDWSFSVTGWADSKTGSPEKKQGKVAFALTSPVATRSQLAYFKSRRREEIQYEAMLFALDFLISELK